VNPLAVFSRFFLPSHRRVEPIHGNWTLRACIHALKKYKSRHTRIVTAQSAFFFLVDIPSINFIGFF
jgi:hypothetical protein